MFSLRAFHLSVNFFHNRDGNDPAPPLLRVCFVVIPGLHDLQLHSHLLMVICLREWRNQRKRMTRNGKIARLPAALREELNQRLPDGEQGQPWVEWLNSLPQVQSVLRAKFQGIPIWVHIYAQRLKIEQNKHPQIDSPARTSGRSSTGQYKSVYK